MKKTAGIIIVTHRNPDEMMRHYKYHKDIFGNVKVWYRHGGAISHPDVQVIRVSFGQVCGSGLRTLFNIVEMPEIYDPVWDYFCIIEHDCFIIDSRFLEKCVHTMEGEKLNCLFPQVRMERKAFFEAQYSHCVKHYGIDPEHVGYSIPTGTVINREGLECYFKNTDYTTFHEVDAYCCLRAKTRVAQNPYISEPGFTTGVNPATVTALYDGHSSVLHSVKSYDMFFGCMERRKQKAMT